MCGALGAVVSAIYPDDWIKRAWIESVRRLPPRGNPRRARRGARVSRCARADRPRRRVLLRGRSRTRLDIPSSGTFAGSRNGRAGRVSRLGAMARSVPGKASATLCCRGRARSLYSPPETRNLSHSPELCFPVCGRESCVAEAATTRVAAPSPRDPVTVRGDARSGSRSDASEPGERVACPLPTRQAELRTPKRVSLRVRESVEVNSRSPRPYPSVRPSHPTRVLVGFGCLSPSGQSFAGRT